MQPNAELYPWISIAAIAWGVLDVFFGYRVFKITLALAGGLLGALGAHFAATVLKLDPAFVTAATLIGGLAGAGLAFLLYLAAVFVAGFCFGATLGLLLLSHFHQMVALLSGCVLGIVGGFLAVKVQRVLIILSTATFGSFRATLALAYFTSQIDWLFYWGHPDQMPVLIDSHAWMLPAILALAAIGVIAQLELGGSGKKKNKDKED